MTLFAFLGYPDVYSWLQAWLPIIFMGLLVIGVFALMRFMPRTRPEKVKPDDAPSIGWAEIAGSEEAKEELREVVDYLRDPSQTSGLTGADLANICNEAAIFAGRRTRPPSRMLRAGCC